MKIKKNIVYVVLLWIAPMLFFTACEDEALKFDDNEFASVLYLADVGEVSVDFYNVNEDITYTTSIGKGGTKNDIARDAKLRVWTTTELESYNEATGTNYRLLPESCYSFQGDFLFSATDERKSVEIILKKQLGNLEKDVEYVLPIELISTNYSVNKNRARLFLKPIIITPKIALESTGKQDVISMTIKDTKVTTATAKASLVVNMKNQGWSFGVNFESDLETLRSHVEQYQSTVSNGITYQLLPAANYKIPEINFGGTDNKKEVDIVLDRKGLPVGHYLLPVVLKESIGMPFDVSKEISYVHLQITEAIPKIALTAGSLFANSTDGTTLPTLINGLYDDNGWQSQWYNASISKPISDPKYGIYIDIKDISVSSLARMILTIKTTHNNPKHIQIYGGNSESDLKLIHENMDCYPNSGTNKRYDTGDIAVENIKMIRIALISNTGNFDLRNLQFYSGTYIRNVSLSEIELFGL